MNRTETAKPVSGWLRYSLAFLAGAFLACGNAPFSLFPLICFLALSCVLMLLQKTASKRQAFLTGLSFGSGYFGLTLHWIVQPFFVHPEIHGWMAPFALLFLSEGMAIFWALAFLAARALARNPVSLSIAFVLALSIAEWLRATIFTGFPWGMLSGIWIGTPFDQMLAYFGPYGLTLLTLLIFALPLISGKLSLPGLAVSICLLISLYATGSMRTAPLTAPLETRPIVRIIQPNAPQHLKWHPDHMQTFFERQLAFSAEKAQEKPDLVIWPETAVPFIFGYDPKSQNRMADAAGGARLIAGIRRWDGNLAFNSLMVVEADGQVSQIYDKHHLVPFGEYIPLAQFFAGSRFRPLANLSDLGYVPGPGPRVLNDPLTGDFLPLICYEAIFPYAMFADGPRPNWILHLTNDAWFGSFAGPYQHLAQTRMRAIEQGLPVVRSANTGISALIDPFGRVIDSLPLGQAGFLDVRLPEPAAPTFYSKWREIPFALMIIAGLVAGATATRRRG